ncbi:sensor histidine kinase, partial [Enterococcus faecium]|uniref:ATP-binding protein n=1 Tax=Enterococcus faecium TaxID=1352 RepID=UPI003F421302
AFTGPRAVTLLGRPTALRRAFSNLIDNAVKYGKTAAVKLAEDATGVQVTVEDEGPGIPRHERERVFEPFYRSEAARSPDQAGVGL